ncbi:MAG: hypothetical protein GX639_13410 [Fibrobacter sp.]|nr:hypothetical protein [Fibrobacter sp.]
MADTDIQTAINSFNQNTSIDFSKYRYLVATMGKVYTSVICFCQAFKPEKIHLIVSPETTDAIEPLFEELKSIYPISLAQFTWRECSSTSIPDIYQHLLMFTKDKSAKQILFDITNGKKSMAAAAVMAASILDADIVYGDFSEYDWENHRPVLSTMCGKLLENPYNVFGDLEIQRAKNLMKRSDFTGAVSILEHLENRVNYIGNIKELRILAEALQFCDSFNFQEAKQKLDLIKSTDKIVKPQLEVMNSIVTVLTDRNNKDFQLFELINFFFYGKRLAGNGKHDLGVFLMFRIIERYAQLRLEEKSISASNVDPSVFSDTVYLKFCEYKKMLYGKSARIDQKPPLIVSCLEAYLILHAIEHPAFKMKDEISFLKHIKELCEKRNKSIYTHGNSPLTADDYQLFEKTAKSLFCKYLHERSSYSFNQLDDLLSYQWLDIV